MKVCKLGRLMFANYHISILKYCTFFFWQISYHRFPVTVLNVSLYIETEKSNNIIVIGHCSNISKMYCMEQRLYNIRVGLMLFSIITSCKSKIWYQVPKSRSFLPVTVFGCVSYELNRKVDKEIGGIFNTLKNNTTENFLWNFYRIALSLQHTDKCYGNWTTETGVSEVHAKESVCVCVCVYIYICICVLHTTSITYTAIILHEALLIYPSFSLHICKQHGQWQPTQTTDKGIKKQKYIHTPDRRTALPSKHCRFPNILK